MHVFIIFAYAFFTMILLVLLINQDHNFTLLFLEQTVLIINKMYGFVLLFGFF